eukprot:TRINITY_DN1388_c0_g1_i1.p1 TRINITY_DN1388_c0_g1~~TRINITY_DN1388_c0_g1_i1.p1  ORF type:complete len:324 (-),score=37.85 TRINITY_DN1388_c0_g1_i1:29-1000(-)
MASTPSSSVDTGHEDMIHDAQMDYYGKRLATCSSDRTIKIFNVVAEAKTHTATLTGHEGPVWQVAWAHPKFGSVLASCSYDRRVLIWKETNPNEWSIIYEHRAHDLSVNSVEWAPQEYGLSLACCSSDSHISIITLKGENSWSETKFQAHQIGVNSLSWAPPVNPGSLVSANAPAQPAPRRLVSGGCDNLVKIWRYHDTDNQWRVEETLEGDQSARHTDWIRDVAWAPNIGLPSSTIASCSQDGTVIVWTKEVGSSAWSKTLLPKFSEVVWRVSWSITGNILAVSCGDNKVSLWKEAGGDGEIRKISELDEQGVMAYEGGHAA